MIDDLPDPEPIEEKKNTRKMARMTRMARMARSLARMARWLADLADPDELTAGAQRQLLQTEAYPVMHNFPL